MIQTLNGVWNYRIGKGEWTTTKVPFSALCVGHSECQRLFDLEGKGDIKLLKFDGITYNARVYLNDTFIGTMLPYCEYTFDISDIVKARGNSLIVEIEDVDASFGPSEGWENYGGIIRDVSIVYKKKGYIENVFFTQELTNGYLDAQYSVRVCATEPLDYYVSLLYNGKVIDDYVANTEQKRYLTGVHTWSPDAPNLYTLRVELLENGYVIDSYETRVGFREFKCNKNHFSLNGNDIFLKGVCRHEMCKNGSGHTVSYKEIYSDMKMIKDSGCNFVRLVHYPHNKVTLDIADELGLLCCEEPGMWQADVKNTELTSQCLQVLKKTVIRDRNHPSIVFWLAFNECDFEEEFLKSAVRVCRENDGTRLVSGANNMSNEDTKKYYKLCELDFYTMHPYSNTFEMARVASKELCDMPLMFTEWGGYYVYDNPSLLVEFLTSMYELYKNNALAGTCLWYWGEINDFNRGAPACIDGALKEALVDFDRNPNLIYDAFCKTIKGMEFGAFEKTDVVPVKTTSVQNDYEVKHLFKAKGTALECLSEPCYDTVLSVARLPLKTRLAKTRKKQFEFGPIMQNEEIVGISKIPYLLSSSPLVFEGIDACESISILGMTSLNYGYPILGKYGEDVAEILITYADGGKQQYIAKNGVDITIAYCSVGSSRINPVCENAKRLLSFSYDKNFEEYIVNSLEIKAESKPISKVEIKALNDNYNVLIYGILA